MTYVLDPSVALKIVLPEADSGRAVRLRDEYASGVHHLIAADLFTSEVANGLVAAERQRRIKPGEAAILFRALLWRWP
jgi:predicted nucleic acid-binding protein